MAKEIEITSDMKAIAQKIAQIYKDKIEEADAVATGRLLNFTTDIEVNGSWVYVVFNMPLSSNGFPYWMSVEEGSKPHWVPLDVIKKWIELKPKRIIPDKNGRIPTINQQARAIRYSISQYGTEAKHLLSSALEESDDLIDEFIDAIYLGLEEEINKEIESV